MKHDITKDASMVLLEVKHMLLSKSVYALVLAVPASPPAWSPSVSG
jgi:hypothetical protein